MRNEIQEIGWVLRLAFGLAVIGAAVGAGAYVFFLAGWRTPTLYGLGLLVTDPTLAPARLHTALAGVLGALIGAFGPVVFLLSKKGV